MQSTLVFLDHLAVGSSGHLNWYACSISSSSSCHWLRKVAPRRAWRSGRKESEEQPGWRKGCRKRERGLPANRRNDLHRQSEEVHAEHQHCRQLPRAGLKEEGRGKAESAQDKVLDGVNVEDMVQQLGLKVGLLPVLHAD